MVQHINSESFNALKASGKPTLVDFWATWCGPCKRIAPIIEELGAEYEGRANVAKCDVEEAEDLAVDFQVTSIPTLILLDKEGNVAQRLVGVQSKAKLQEELDKLL